LSPLNRNATVEIFHCTQELKIAWIFSQSSLFLSSRFSQKITQHLKDKENMMAHAFEVTDANFGDEVLNSKTPVMVDFWAEWCGPCKMIAPTVAELAKEYEGRAKVVKLDVDSNYQTADIYDVRSIPTLLFFKNGKVVDKIVGVQSKQKLKEKLDASL
jgi:thioredoxin 1